MKIGFSAAFARLLRDAVPRATEEFRRNESDAAQTIVWLVGLATTLLALAGAYPERVRQLLQADYKIALACLLTTVLGGVLYRVLGLQLSGQHRALAMRLHNHLLGYEAGIQTAAPAELSERWDEVEIVRRLRTEFDLDYSFLTTYRTPLKGCRQAYQAQFDIWKRHENESVAGLQRVVAAHAGLTAKESQAMMAPLSEQGLNKIHLKAMGIRVWLVVNGLVFTAAAIAFMAAMFFVTRGLWRL